MVVPLKTNGRPSDGRRVNRADLREEEEFPLQVCFIRLLHLRVPHQKNRRSFQNLVKRIVFREFTVLACQKPLSGKAVSDGSLQVDFSPHGGNVLPAAQILPVKPLLELNTDSPGKDRCKQIMGVLKTLSRNAFIAVLTQCGEGVGEHIIDVLNKNTLIFCH